MKKRRIWFVFKRLIIKLFITYINIFSIIKLNGEFQSLFNYKSVEKYKSVVEDFEEFLKEENISNPINIFDYFSYALWNGYLSYNHNFRYSANREPFVLDAGLQCIRGDAACSNNAEFLKSLFTSYGYKSYVVSVYMDFSSESEYQNSYDLLIKFVLEPVLGNHAITCVEYKDEIYYFDPTNMIYLGKTGINELSIIDDERKMTIKYLSSSIFDSLNVIFDLFNTSPEEFNAAYSLILDKNILSKLEEFYQKHKNIYTAINDELSEKNQVFIICICSLFSTSCLKILKFILKKFSFTSVYEEKMLYTLNKYLLDNNIKDCAEIVRYLNFLIKKGYLSYEKENNKYTIRLFLKKEYPTLAFVDDEYTNEFIKYFLEYINCGVTTINMMVNGEEDEVLFILDDTNKYYFYSAKLDQFIPLKQLADENKDITLFNDSQIVENSLFPETIEVEKAKKMDAEISESFYTNNKKLIEKINKKLAYIPKK